MAAVTQAGDVLSIPAYKPDFENGIISFVWSQSLRDRTGIYYQVACKNVTRGNKDVLLYVQKDWYHPENAGAGEHISHFTKKNDCYEVTVDARFQYGQKNKEGECRFLVYHDKGRKPYQHRFMATAIASKAADWGTKLAQNMGYGSLADQISSAGNRFVGDYLHTY